MKIRRFSTTPTAQTQTQPAPQLPPGVARAEFVCPSSEEDGFPEGGWHAILLKEDGGVEYRRLKLAGYQPLRRLVAGLAVASPAEAGEVIRVLKGGAKIMSVNNRNR